MQTSLSAPFGTLVLSADDHALTRIWWPCEDAPAEERLAGPHSVLDAACDQLRAYLDGRLRDFSLPLATQGTPWQQKVWAELQRISYGETLSYSQLAARLGRPTASRAVGSANSRNRLGIVVPCHRVIAADGSPGGFAGGVEAKRWLLDLERAHRT